VASLLRGIALLYLIVVWILTGRYVKNPFLGGILCVFDGFERGGKMDMYNVYNVIDEGYVGKRVTEVREKKRSFLGKKGSFFEENWSLNLRPYRIFDK